jgi:hypothetical protein
MFFLPSLPGMRRNVGFDVAALPLRPNGDFRSGVELSGALGTGPTGTPEQNS